MIYRAGTGREALEDLGKWAIVEDSGERAFVDEPGELVDARDAKILLDLGDRAGPGEPVDVCYHDICRNGGGGCGATNCLHELFDTLCAVTNHAKGTAVGPRIRVGVTAPAFGELFSEARVATVITNVVEALETVRSYLTAVAIGSAIAFGREPCPRRVAEPYQAIVLTILLIRRAIDLPTSARDAEVTLLARRGAGKWTGSVWGAGCSGVAVTRRLIRVAAILFASGRSFLAVLAERAVIRDSGGRSVRVAQKDIAIGTAEVVTRFADDGQASAKDTLLPLWAFSFAALVAGAITVAHGWAVTVAGGESGAAEIRNAGGRTTILEAICRVPAVLEVTRPCPIVLTSENTIAITVGRVWFACLGFAHAVPAYLARCFTVLAFLIDGCGPPIWRAGADDV